MKSLKDQARSILDRLSNISKKEKVPFQLVLTEFLLERLAVRILADSNLSEVMVFKGGYVNLRVYSSPRYTIDLDASLKKLSLEKIQEPLCHAVQKNLGDGVWFSFETSVDLETQGEYGGLRLTFRSGVGEILSNLKRAQIINLDVGKGDPIVPDPLLIETPYLLGGGTLSWRVYPAETTVAEKLHALITRGSENSRSKDIFDLTVLIPRCDPQQLLKAIQKTFEHRESSVPSKMHERLKQMDVSLLKRGWGSAVEGMPQRWEFDEVFSELIKLLEKIDLG